jgi:Cu/Ag efflux pump CusA
VEVPIEEPTLEIEVDLAAAQTHGIKPGDVRRQAAILLSGLQVGALFEEQKVFDVVVWGTPEMRQSLTNVRELLIETPGGHVRLGDVAAVRITSAPAVIHREAISPYLDVALTVQGQDAPAVTRDAQAALKDFPFTLEYHAEVFSGSVAQQAADQRLLLVGCRGDRDLPALAGSLQELAPGPGCCPDLAHGPGGRCAGGSPEWRHPLTEFAPWLSCRVGNCDT